MGVYSEFLLRILNSRSEEPSSVLLKTQDSTAAGSSSTFLSSRLRYSVDSHGQEVCLVDSGPAEEVGVMMGWERPISRSGSFESFRFSHLDFALFIFCQWRRLCVYYVAVKTTKATSLF